jgi:hypothetical protein
METTHKAANSAHKSFGKLALTIHLAAETPCETGDPLKKAEQQLMKNYQRYVRYNPWITQ